MTKRPNDITILLLVPPLLIAAACVKARGQMPVADGATGPAIGSQLPRKAGRGAAVQNLFGRTGWVRTSALDVPALLNEDARSEGGPRRMGIVQELTIDTARDGQWTPLKDAGWLWTVRIQAPGALATRVRLEPWNPPAGAELTLSTPDGAFSWGPLTASYRPHPTRLWTPTLNGDAVHIEWYVPAEIDHLSREAQLHITGLLNQYLSAEDALREMSCHNDATCDGAWAGAAAGVGALASIGVSLPAGFFCSGAMLTRIPADFAPMFMTATHCGVTDANADTTEVTWFWQRTHPMGSECPNGVVPNANNLPMTVGSTVLAQDVTTDWTLIGLRSAVPGGVTWEGWDPNVLANGSAVTGIHHPDGSWKRISYGTKTADNGSRPNPMGGTSCVSGTAYRVEYRSDLGNGLTEPGSSGSPIFDASQRVRGTLSCGGANCAGTSTSTYGRFDAAYTILEPYLVPADPVYANRSYGGFERGTFGQPFNSVLEASHAVIAGHDVWMQAGSYNETLVIDRPMTLRNFNGTVTIGQ